MAATNVTDLNVFKERYADKVEKNLPNFAIVQGDIPFTSDKKNGKKYIQPVRLKRPFGWTFASTSDVKTPYTLQDARAGFVDDAEVEGAGFTIREQVAKSLFDRGKTPDQVVQKTFDLVIGAMIDSGRFASEISALYGGSSIGTIETENDSGAVSDLVITRATWAPGLWSQAIGMPLDVYSAPGGTKRNTNPLIVTDIDEESRQIEVTGTVSGDVSGIGVGDVVIPFGGDGAMYTGIDTILTNTGTLFGVSAADYPIWKGNVVSNGSAAATLSTFMKAGHRVAVRGGMFDLCCYVSTATWTDLNVDAAALRRLGEKEKGKVELGSKSIEYYGPSGVMEIKPHPMVKQGEAFCIHKRSFRRGGTNDLHMESDLDPKLGVPNYFFILQGSVGYELRMSYDQYLFCTAPSRCAKITGLLNANDVGA